MRAISWVFGMVVISLGAVEEAEAQSVVTRVYRENDLGHYYADPPYWSYHQAWWNFAGGHWLYRNRQRVFIDIKLEYAGPH